MDLILSVLLSLDNVTILYFDNGSFFPLFGMLYNFVFECWELCVKVHKIEVETDNFYAQ